MANRHSPRQRLHISFMYRAALDHSSFRASNHDMPRVQWATVAEIFSLFLPGDKMNRKIFFDKKIATEKFFTYFLEVNFTLKFPLSCQFNSSLFGNFSLGIRVRVPLCPTLLYGG